MRTLVFLAAAVILSAGCSASRGCQLCTAPSSPAHFDVIATNDVHSLSMHVGQRLEVVLRASKGLNNWTHPESSDRSVLSPIVDPAATAARGVTLAAFEVIMPGQVTVSSNASPACSPGQACPMLIAVYSLKVAVTQ